MKKTGVTVIPVLEISRAYEELKQKKIDAVVIDAPVALYYEKKFNTQLEIVGEVFEKQQYGVAMQRESPLRKEINQAILLLQESGQYDAIYRKWFGDDLMMEVQ